MPKRVLLIDDDERLVDALRIRLIDAGYDVFTALDGEAGLSEAALFVPDVIILDVRMPKMDGYDVCRLIRTVPELREIPIIILSANAIPTGILAAGGDVFVRKPYQAAELLGIVRAAIGGLCGK